MIPQITFILFSSHDDPSFWAILGAVAGAYLFCRGFHLLGRKRLIMDTPSSKIRSASMGLVEVSGLATGPYTIPAPITGMPCYYYHTMAWTLKQSGKNRSWEKAADESLHVPFYVDDNTGRVLVNPQGAEMNVHRDFQDEFSHSFFSTSLEIPNNVGTFLAAHGVSSDQKVKVEEYCIKPKNALFILGTLAENPGLKVTPNPVRSEIRGEIKRSSADWGKRVLSLLSAGIWSSTSEPEPEMIPPAPQAKPAKTLDATAQARVAAAMVKAGITNPVAWAVAGVQYPGMTAHSTGGGTAAAPAPAAEFDLNPKTVLMKGAHNPAFFISWQSQKELLRSLGWKSALMIWGGPAITVLCVYLLTGQLGWR